MKNFLLGFVLICISGINHAQRDVTIDFSKKIAIGSPFVFGAAQPTGLSNNQWNMLKKHGFTFARSQADLAKLVPCTSPTEYLKNTNGCANPENWDWKNGIYGGDFAQQAIDREMKVCLVIKNAIWNRYAGAPVDEETIPKDLKVWQDIVKKIINHYKGGITYIECFNEVDRRPDQFFVKGSPYNEKDGYKQVVEHAIAAGKASDYPETRIGGPASAGFGLKEMEWLLEEKNIRENLGFVSFHDFDNPEYPHAEIQKIKNLLTKYNSDAHIVRSSHTPEYNRNHPSQKPGLTRPEYVAPLIIGALKDGLDAIGFWEIQNKTHRDDHRYWFNGDSVVKTANTFVLMSKTLFLGEGYSQIFDVNGLDFEDALGAINAKGEYIAVLVNSGEALKINLTLKNIESGKESHLQIYRGDAVDIGVHPVETLNTNAINKTVDLTYELPARSVIGFKITPKQ